MNSGDALASLKDIEGVYGSFVVDESGELALRDLPAIIDDAALREAGPRVARLWAAFPEDDAPEYVMLEFASHQVFIKKFDSGSLCVFVPPNVNRLALRMAANFVGRWLDARAKADAAPSYEPPPSASAVTPIPPDASFFTPVPGSGPVPTNLPQAPAGHGAAVDAHAPAMAGKKRTYIYRGQRYEG